MTGLKSNKVTPLVIGVILFVMVACYFIGGKIYREHKVQVGFQNLYGADWKEFYEKRYGPGSLKQANIQTIVGFVSMPVIGILLGLISWQISRDKSGGTPLHHRKAPKQKNEW